LAHAGFFSKNWQEHFLKIGGIFLRMRGFFYESRTFFYRRFAVICFLAYGKYLRRWRLTAGKKFAERYLFAVCSLLDLPEVLVYCVSFPIFAEGLRK
jgi:hypothetical protein